MGRQPRSPLDQFFNDPFFKNDPMLFGGAHQSLTARSQPLTAHARPLPPFTGPGKFSGLVGRFDIRAELDKPSLAVGESTTLTVTIEGAGNLPDAGKPDFAAPQGFKVYEEAPQSEIDAAPDGYRGKRVFRYVLAPYSPGQATIPAIELTSFDPATGEYASARTQPLALNIQPGAQQETPVVASSPAAAPGQAKSKVEFLRKDLLPIRQGLSAATDRRPLPWLVFAGLFLAPTALFGLALLVRALAGKERGAASVMAQRADQALKAALTCCNARPPQTAEALSHCAKALTAAVLSRAGRAGESLTYQEIEAVLANECACPDEAAAAKALMEHIDSVRYGGGAFDANDLGAMVQETRRLARKLCP